MLLGLVILVFAITIVVWSDCREMRRELRELRGSVTVLRRRLDALGAPSASDLSHDESVVGDDGVPVEAPDAAAEAGPWGPVPSPIPSPSLQGVAAAQSGASAARGFAHALARAKVRRRRDGRRLAAWFSKNWFYAVSAASLALAGIFLVQYGVENSLFPPSARVLSALVFGAALIGAGEFIRRRHGDGEGVATAYLPSVFSGAGIVTLFGGVLAGRVIYDLIGAEVAMGGLIAVGLVALLLGWFHGPLLAAVGILGSFAAPFVVGGSADDPSGLYTYFAVIAALGLGIDTMRRWGWITGLTLILAYGAGTLLALVDPSTRVAFALFVAALAGLAVLVPVRRVIPDHSGAVVAELFVSRAGTGRPSLPACVAFAAVLASSVALLGVSAEGVTEFWLSILLLTCLAAALIVGSQRAVALQDVALIPAIGFVAALAWQGWEQHDVRRSFQATYELTSDASFPLAMTALMGLAALLSLLACWRALADQGPDPRFGVAWAVAAALLAPGSAALLELMWSPAAVIGTHVWAAHALAVALLMVVFAERLARADGPDDRRRMALPAVSALAMLAFACTILFVDTALTLALVATVVAAAALDRMFRIPLMTAFITVGTLAIGGRLVIDPGLDFAFTGPLGEVAFVYIGALAGFIASLYLITPLERPVAKAVLDGAAWTTAGLLAAVVLNRWLRSLAPAAELSHWAVALNGLVWLGLMGTQLRLLTVDGVMRRVRKLLAISYGVLGFAAVIAALTVLNPVLFTGTGDVIGLPVFNTLAIAYLMPAFLFGAIALTSSDLGRKARIAFGIIAFALAVYWVFTAIRHGWQGPDRMTIDRGISQPELYSYTVALLIVGTGLFYQSLARGSAWMRRAGFIVIGLAIAKVFLIDVSGLSGLTRVFSFLLLGLALAGLAWVGRWAQRNVADAQSR